MALVIYLRYITMPDLKSYKKYNASSVGPQLWVWSAADMALVIYLRYITMPDLKSYKKYNASSFFLELKFVF